MLRHFVVCLVQQKTKQSSKLAGDIRAAQANVNIVGSGTPDLAKVTAKRLQAGFGNAMRMGLDGLILT